MAFHDLLVTEIFHSIQGETSLAGLPFAFIRLTGCNLRCTYCDTAYAFKGGRKMTEDQIVEAIRPYGVQHALLTGGEPLMQRPTPALAKRLKKEGFDVSVETHGEAPIDSVVEDCRIVMDIKTPSSGMSRGGFERNLPLLKPSDEIKFVIASKYDYEWSARWVKSGRLRTREILFSPASPAPGMPGRFEGVTPRWLAEKILADRLPVRMQLQLHKIVWSPETRGV